MASVDNVPQQPEQVQNQDVLQPQPELQEDPQQKEQQKEQQPSAMKKWQSEGGLDAARRKASVNDNGDAEAKESQAPSGYSLRKRKSGGEVAMTTAKTTTTRATKTKKVANDVEAEKGALIIKRGRRSGGAVKKVPTNGEVIQDDKENKAGEDEGSKKEDSKFKFTAMDEEDLAPARQLITDAAPTSVNLIREEPVAKPDDHAAEVEDDGEKKDDDDDVGKENDDGDQDPSGAIATDAGNIEAEDEANAGQTAKEEQDDTLTEENADTTEAAD